MTDFLTIFEPKTTTVYGYERLGRCKAHLRAKSERCWSRSEHERIGALLGYNTSKGGFTDRFAARRREYGQLQRDVPLAYLDAIGADRAELFRCLADDFRAYEDALFAPRFPKGAGVRLMPTVYIAEYFESGTLERRAIQILAEKHPTRVCTIHYGDLLLVTVHRRVRTASYSAQPPELRFTSTALTTAAAWRNVGQTRLK